MRKTLTLMYLIAVVLPWLGLTRTNAQALTGYQAKARVDEKAIASAVANPRIQAYDLSPDGARIALFVVSGDLVDAPSWIVIASTKNSQVLKQVRFGTNRVWVQGYAPQLAFTADGRLLVVQDGQTVNVLDATSLVKLRSVSPDAANTAGVPAGILIASKSNTAAISFGDGTPVTAYLDKRPIHTEMVDIASGKHVASWDTNDLPLAISPNGEFVAVSDHATKGAVMGVDVLEATTGKTVATLSGEFRHSKEMTRENFGARAIPKFTADDEVLLTPDGNRDQSGHDAGEELMIVRFKSAQIVQKIEPEHYGPTGEVAVSADQKTFVAISRYIAPKYLTHHLHLPADSRPELLTFSRPQVFQLEDRTQLPNLLTLRMRSLFDSSGLRISADASIVSVAEDYGVTILQRK